ncbi:hypothetical protein DCC62_22830 [candidate division KSB1 bacterium]|nr:MAG: hypothetical protein DCC62_22830 [candidate division KSB1 bacterium]
MQDQPEISATAAIIPGRSIAASVVINFDQSCRGQRPGFSSSEKRHYKYAYNSARECIPILATACSLEIVSAELHQKLRDDFTGVIKMLAKLVKSVDKNSKAGVKK